MSQEKVDKRKKEKYERKHQKGKSKIKKSIPYIIVSIIALLFVLYFVASSLDRCGVIKLPQMPTTHREWSTEEVQSLRSSLQQNGDKNVKGNSAAPQGQQPQVQQAQPQQGQQPVNVEKKAKTKKSGDVNKKKKK